MANLCTPQHGDVQTSQILPGTAGSGSPSTLLITALRKHSFFFFFFLQKVSPKSSVLIFYLFTVLRRPKLVLSMKLHQSAGQWEPFPGVLWLKITPFGGEDPGSLFVFMSSVNLI